MSQLASVRLEVDGSEVHLHGPSGAPVVLAFACERRPEANDEDPECKDRVLAEWARNVDGELKVVVFVYSRDSYDGTHREIVEDGRVCRPLVQGLLGDLGVSGTEQDFVAWLATQHPNVSSSLTALLDPEYEYMFDDMLVMPELI